MGDVAESSTELEEVGSPGRECGGMRVTGGDFGAVIGGNGIENHEADGVALESGGELVADDVILGFKVRGPDREDTSQGGRSGCTWDRGAEERVLCEELGQAWSGQ